MLTTTIKLIAMFGLLIAIGIMAIVVGVGFVITQTKELQEMLKDGKQK